MFFMPPPPEVHRDVLANGLIVVTVALPHLHTASIVMYARVGSRYETPATNGLSHFVEHMLFRGSKSFPDSFALNYAIEDVGGTLYAETGRDYSLYQISLHPESLPRGIEIFGDIFAAPALRDIELERKIILEELLEDIDEEGRLINVDDVARKAIWPQHGLGLSITGPLANVERFVVEDVQRHFIEFYGASNMVLCVSGATRREQVLEWAQRWMSPLRAGERQRPTPPEDWQHAPQTVYVENEAVRPRCRCCSGRSPSTTPTTWPCRRWPASSTTECRPGCITACATRWGWPTMSAATWSPSTTPRCSRSTRPAPTRMCPRWC